MASPIALERVLQQIDQMAPPEQLRLAADLLEAKHPEIAHAITSKVADELATALMLARMKKA